MFILFCFCFYIRIVLRLLLFLQHVFVYICLCFTTTTNLYTAFLYTHKLKITLLLLLCLIFVFLCKSTCCSVWKAKILESSFLWYISVLEQKAYWLPGISGNCCFCKVHDKKKNYKYNVSFIVCASLWSRISFN